MWLKSVILFFKKILCFCSNRRRKKARWVLAQFAEWQQGKKHVQCMQQNSSISLVNSLHLETDLVSQLIILLVLSKRKFSGSKDLSSYTKIWWNIAIASGASLTQGGGKAITKLVQFYKLEPLSCSNDPPACPSIGALTPLSGEMHPFFRYMPSHSLSITQCIYSSFLSFCSPEFRILLASLCSIFSNQKPYSEVPRNIISQKKGTERPTRETF